MDRLKVESKSSSGKWVVWGSCLLVCVSLFATRLVSSTANDGGAATITRNFADLSDENSLFHEAYTTWNCNRQFEASQKLYRRLFANGAGKPFMHVAYADMLVANNQREEALKEYRLGAVAGTHDGMSVSASSAKPM